MVLLLSPTVCGMHPLKPSYSNFKSTRNYIKHSGLKKYVRQKPDLIRHQCENCDKTFQNEMMKCFHKANHCPKSDCKNSRNTVTVHHENGGVRAQKPNQLQNLSEFLYLFNFNYFKCSISKESYAFKKIIISLIAL